MKKEKNAARFLGFWLVVFGALIGMFFARNIVTMYMFFETVTFTSLPLVMHSGTREALKAGQKYLFYSVGGAFIGLWGLFWLITFTSGADFSIGGIAGIGGALALPAMFLILIGFGAKAGSFPMHAWLSAAHPVAPSPASAVLSGVITKAGVFAIIRTLYYVAGPNLIAGTWVQTAWISLVLLTILLGSFMAYKEPALKRRLAYSSISQLSYILLGLALVNSDGFIGGLTHVIFHSVVKDGLFLCVGAIIYKTGLKNADEMKGIGRRMPLTLGIFTLLSLALVGIPPFCGFFSKWYLVSGALSSGLKMIEWLAPVVLLISAVLTAAYLYPIVFDGFFPGNNFKYSTVKRDEAPASMLVPCAVFALASFALGLFSNIITDYINSIW